MSTEASFLLFGPVHRLAIGIILGLALVLPWTVRRWASEETRRRIAWGLAGVAVAQEIAKAVVHIAVVGNPWQENLPLHLCGVAIFLAGWVLVTGSVRAYELVYFWGLGGTLQAILTPDLPYDFPHWVTSWFFVSHGLVVVCAMYATVVQGLRPTLGSIPRVFLATLAYAAAMFLYNLAFGTNYLYLMAKPERTSLMDFMGPWPWTIGSLAVAGLVSFGLYYLPFAVADLLRSPAPAAARGLDASSRRR